MAKSCSEGTDEERWVEGLPSTSKKRIDCEKLSLKNSHEQVESFWVRIRDRGNKSNLVADVYYRLPD